MDELVEREAEIGSLRLAVEQARAGMGSAAVILGPAGIGKSSLLQTVAGPILRARGGELEREFPYGVVRQLFEEPLRKLDDDILAAALSGPARPVAALLLEDGDSGGNAESVDSFALEHAFFWLTAHLAEREPLVLVVDDAHWADLASMRVLLYLARRIADLPVAVLLSTRPVDDVRRALIDRIVAEAGVVLEPAPLTTSGVQRLLHRRLAAADESFSEACHSASGGNPFLVSELIGAVEASGIEPIGPNASRVRSVGAQSVSRSVLLRLSGLSRAASSLARTLAVVGEGLSHAMLAELAEVAEYVGAAIAELRIAHIIEPDEPMRFVHSIVRDAVYADTSQSDRSRLHRAAAESLSERGAPIDTVASHLLHTTPGFDAWTFSQLVAAASGPAVATVPEAVATYLDRALRETVKDVDRAPLLLALGASRFQTVKGDAVGPLTEAREVTDDRDLRLEATRALASAYMTEQRFAEAWSVIEDTIVEFGDEPERAHDLEIFSTQSLYIEVDAESLGTLLARVRAWQPNPTGVTGQDRSMLAVQAWAASTSVAPDSDPAAAARAALSTRTLLSDDVWYVTFDVAVWSLIMTGCHAEALDHLDGAIDSCIGAGRLLRAATLAPLRAELRRRLGLLALAQDDVRFAGEVLPPEQIYAPQAVATRVLLLIETGELSTASHLLATHRFDADIPFGGMTDVLRFARGRLRIASGDLPGGVEDLLAYGAICDRMERRNPGHYAWRSALVGPLVQLGRPEQARLLATEEYDLAEQTGVIEQRGQALLALGVASDAADRSATLLEAITTLESSAFVLDAALARLTLGRVLRREGKRDLAREHLRIAADVATRIGATATAKAAQKELVASGLRPRRLATTGVDSLTAGESRVASLAANGMTNREIAHVLFVTPKTIETHLAGVYRKLGIAGKGELSAALARP